MARIDLGLGLIVAIGLLAGIALAMGMGQGMGQAGPMMGANTNVDQHQDSGYEDYDRGYGPMGSMGPMMGAGSYEDMGPYGAMNEMCHEEMEEHMYGEYGGMYAWDDEAPYHDDDDRFFRLHNVTGIIVDVSDRFNAIKVETEDGETVWIKLTSQYIEVDTGYLVAGSWIAEVIEDYVDANETLTINAVITGSLRGPRAALGLSIEVPELGFYFENPMYFDRTR